MNHHDTTAPEPSTWRRVWSPPEPEISTAGFGGELLVAGVRLLLAVVLLYFPLQELRRKPGGYDPLALLTMATIGLLLALIVYSATSRRWGRTWMGFASSLLDVSLVSSLLVIPLLLDRPHEATNNLVVFPIYFLAIAATSLRYDARICVLTGALAVAQYAAIILYAAWRWDLNSAVFAPYAFGLFHWGGQVWRMLLLAGATAIAATIVVRSRELRLLSTRDRFTGLLNRAVFNEQLEREVAVSLREDGRFAVAMIDIDHFKRFNDTYGHAGGDEALRLVAQTLREACRSSDVVARYGGEEFALILPGVMSGRATDLAERIRRVMAVRPIHLPGRPKPATVTISIGVALWPDDGHTPAEVLRCADQRLYQAKAQGRDRVVGPVPGKSRTPEERGERGNDLGMESDTVSIRSPFSRD
ncbi:MAG TPA: GGDEF domain-containing protein [Thermoanaerobaculia bacterium]|nr:GGDEF domain-containing protein [Thermoanaerobaculia bacterium]